MSEQTAKEKAREVESLFTEVFSTDAGKVVLGYIERGLTPRSEVAPESDLYKIGVRDGRRDALYQIKKKKRCSFPKQ